MSRETIYRCDGPDCDRWIQTATPAPARGWLTVHERVDEQVQQLDYCGWSCLLVAAGRIEPEQVIASSF
jgi:hypothetical protein